MPSFHNSIIVYPHGKRSTLFWFCILPLLTAQAEAETASPAPRYLQQPDLILQPVWALPDLSLHSLTDAENTTVINHICDAQEEDCSWITAHPSITF